MNPDPQHWFRERIQVYWVRKGRESGFIIIIRLGFSEFGASEPDSGNFAESGYDFEGADPILLCTLGFSFSYWSDSDPVLLGTPGFGVY